MKLYVLLILLYTDTYFKGIFSSIELAKKEACKILKGEGCSTILIQPCNIDKSQVDEPIIIYNDSVYNGWGEIMELEGYRK